MSIENGRHPASAWFSVGGVVLVCLAGWLEACAPDAYYDAVQEDGPLEWATAWAFFLAAAVSLSTLRGARTPREQARFWRSFYLAGIASGCLLIGLEEISWGQRLFAYRPPDLFLTRNHQQELNLHNLADTGVRKAALLTLLVGFGVLLPVLGRTGPLARWMKKRHVPVPGLSQIPGFAVGAGLYALYPWHNTGEWVECLAGFGLLAAAWDGRSESQPSALMAAVVLMAATTGGLLTPWLIPSFMEGELLKLAAGETQALAEDLEVGRLRSRCGVHKRVYTFVKEYGARRMDRSRYMALADPDRVHAERRAFFLDPWNQPYWIRDDCDTRSGRRVVFVYSFGPDRRRDSSSDGIAGDDVGAYVPRRR